MADREATPKRWLDMKEACVYLGVGLTTLKRAIAEGKLRGGAIPFGARRIHRRFTLEQLDAFLLRAGRTRPKP